MVDRPSVTLCLYFAMPCHAISNSHSNKASCTYLNHQLAPVPTFYKLDMKP